MEEQQQQQLPAIARSLAATRATAERQQPFNRSCCSQVTVWSDWEQEAMNKLRHSSNCILVWHEQVPLLLVCSVACNAGHLAISVFARSVLGDNAVLFQIAP